MIETLEQRKKNIIYTRAMLSFVIVLLGVYKIEMIMESKQYIFFYLFMVVASNLVFALLPDESFEGTKLHYSIFILDIIIIALGGYWLAEMSFVFFIFIFLTIFISALSQSVGRSLLVAIVVNAVYIYMAGMAAGEGYEFTLDPQILLNVPFIFIVALHSGYLAEKAAEELVEKKKLATANMILSGKVKDVSEEIEAVIDFTARVYDGFREGIIITANDGTIIVFNSKSESIFGIRRSSVMNMQVDRIKELGEIGGLMERLRFRKYVVLEKDIKITGGRNLVVNTSIIKDKTGNVLGSLCTIRMPMGALN